MGPIFASFVVVVVVVLIFFTINTVVFDCACNLIEEHGLILLFETVYKTHNVKPCCVFYFGDLVL